MSEFRQIDAGEVTLRAAIEGPEPGTAPLAILVHGFPESWYSWRHQLAPIAAAGYTACAIDVRGYGGSDKPYPVEAYAMERLIADVVGVKQALSPDRPAVLIGHDWGAPIVWNSAFTHPEHFSAVAGLSVPFTGVPMRPFTEVFREHFTSQGRWFYQEYFQEPGVAEAELEADPRDSVARFMYAISGDVPHSDFWAKPVGANLLDGMPDPVPLDWLTEQDRDYYGEQFAASGFRGPLNRYRNHERDFEYFQQFKGRTLDQPALFIGGTRDPASTGFGAIEDPVALMRMFAPNVEGHMLEGCGHWTQQERPDEVNALLIDWLNRL